MKIAHLSRDCCIIIIECVFMIFSGQNMESEVLLLAWLAIPSRKIPLRPI